MEQYNGSDLTEIPRRIMITAINDSVESDDKGNERKRLEKLYGQVWSTEELQRDFAVEGFMAPYIKATEKGTGDKGSMQFQDRPRFYFNWRIT